MNTKIITVKSDAICNTKKIENIQEVDIDRIINQETPPEERQSKTENQRSEEKKLVNKKISITYRINGRWKKDAKKKTSIRVGKLDVRRIEERNKRIENEIRAQKIKKVH